MLGVKRLLHIVFIGEKDVSWLNFVVVLWYISSMYKAGLIVGTWSSPNRVILIIPHFWGKNRVPDFYVQK